MRKGSSVRVRRCLLALGAIATLMPAAANADLVDQISHLLSASGPSVQQEAQVSGNAAAPLGKFAASGRVTESIDTGACPNSLESSTCTSSGGCDQITISGPVNATTLGKSTLSACITITALTSSTFSSCFNGLGNGTITANNGKSLTFGIGGLFCIADAIPASSPTSIIFVGNDTYAVEGGTAPFTNAVGTGTLSFTDVITNLTTTPIAGSGQLTMAGSFAKQ
jgi:hypothetical protein